MHCVYIGLLLCGLWNDACVNVRAYICWQTVVQLCAPNVVAKAQAAAATVKVMCENLMEDGMTMDNLSVSLVCRMNVLRIFFLVAALLLSHSIVGFTTLLSFLFISHVR